MKRIICLLLLTLLLCGCEAKIERFHLDSKYYKEGKIVETDSDKINELTKNKESFAVFVYMSSCSSCSKFNAILEDFTKEYDITFYAIPVQDIKDTDVCECVKYSPSVAIYKDGENVSYLDANSDKDKEYYESVDGFKKWLSKYIYLTN